VRATSENKHETEYKTRAPENNGFRRRDEGHPHSRIHPDANRYSSAWTDTPVTAENRERRSNANGHRLSRPLLSHLLYWISIASCPLSIYRVKVRRRFPGRVHKNYPTRRHCVRSIDKRQRPKQICRVYLHTNKKKTRARPRPLVFGSDESQPRVVNKVCRNRVPVVFQSNINRNVVIVYDVVSNVIDSSTI